MMEAGGANEPTGRQAGDCNHRTCDGSNCQQCKWHTDRHLPGGSLLAGALGKRLQVDGLLLGTVAMGLCGLILLHGLSSAPMATNKESYEHA
jgi:hypothetical protein